MIIHFPETEEGKEKLKKAVADVHIDTVVKYISKLNCPTRQKEKFFKEIIKDD